MVFHQDRQAVSYYFQSCMGCSWNVGVRLVCSLVKCLSLELDNIRQMVIVLKLFLTQGLKLQCYNLDGLDMIGVSKINPLILPFWTISFKVIQRNNNCLLNLSGEMSNLHLLSCFVLLTIPLGYFIQRMFSNNFSQRKSRCFKNFNTKLKHFGRFSFLQFFQPS